MKAEAAEARVRARIADAVVFIFIVVLESSIDQIVMRQNFLATLQQIRRCLFTRKNKQKIKPIERARVCFPVRDYSQFLS